MSFRARVLALALLATVVAVSSALAGGNGSRSAVPQTAPAPGQVAEDDYFIARASTDASHERRGR